MKKKFIGSLLLASLTLASTSTFVSCKDYDDDINDVNKRVDDLAAMKTTLATVEQTVKDLSAQLEDAKAKATAAVGEEQTRAKAAEAALAARLETLEAARTELQNLIDQKVDKSEYQAMVTDVYAKLEAVQTDLGKALTSISGLEQGLKDEEIARKAAIEDLQQQINALNKIGDPTQIVADLEALKENIGTVKIAELKTMLEEASDKVNAALAEINNLNVLIKQALRGLVFVPQSYYWGIEAQQILTLKYDSYALGKTDYSNDDDYQMGDRRYSSTAKEKVLDFVAKYHMNPSSANTNDFKKVEVLSDDKAYTRTAEAGLYVESWAPDNLGGLDVTIRMNDASKVKTVADDNAVTVFATRVTLGDTKAGERDTTITSDYATLYKSTISDLKLAARTGSDVPFYTAANGDSYTWIPCGVTTSKGHLPQTAIAAAGNGANIVPQYYCVYTEDLDLRKLVETHYITAAGEEKVFDPSRYNLTYKFELTGFYLGGEKTSESAHAAIAPDGYTFHPQMVAEDGTQASYPGERGRQTIGRTPLVRISLVDASGNEVYDYGYVKIIITDEKPVAQPDKYISYETGIWKYSGECSPARQEFSNNWVQTEYDIYSMLNITREEFEKYYTADEDASNTATQYYVKSGSFSNQSVIFAKATGTDAHTKVWGTMRHDPSSPGSETTNTVKWVLSGEDAYEYYYENISKYTGNDLNEHFARAMKFNSSNKDKYPDVYVVFFPAKTDIVIPQATLKISDNLKNPKYWYAANSNQAESGFVEIHNNVKTPEENSSGRGDKLEQMFSKVFLGNNIKASDVLTISNDRNGVFANAKLDFVFSKANNGQTYYRETHTAVWNEQSQKFEHNHTSATISVGDNGKSLYVGTEKIAYIDASTVDVKSQWIHYCDNAMAKDLLNYAAHNELDDHAIKAFVTIEAHNDCDKADRSKLNITNSKNEYFTVRFLRPINVKNNNYTMEDAVVGKTNTVLLKDLVSFTDWREAWEPGYDTYYGISNIEVVDVAAGSTLCDNRQVMTNQSGKPTTLFDVNSQLDMTYHPNTDYTKSYIEYKNFGSTVQDFWVVIPVKITYYWGTITTEVTVNISKTVNNSKYHK